MKYSRYSGQKSTISTAPHHACALVPRYSLAQTLDSECLLDALDRGEDVDTAVVDGVAHAGFDVVPYVPQGRL